MKSKIKISKSSIELFFKLLKVALFWFLLFALFALMVACGSKKKTVSRSEKTLAVIQQHDIQETKHEFKEVEIVKTVKDTFAETSKFNNYSFAPVNPEKESEVHLYGNSIYFKNATVNISEKNKTTNGSTTATVDENTTEEKNETNNDQSKLEIDSDKSQTNKNKEVKGGKSWLWWWLFVLGVAIYLIWRNRKRILTLINPVLGWFSKLNL